MQFFNKEVIQQNINKCKANISTFENEILKEKGTIQSYQDMIDSEDSSFPIDALKRGIENSRKNIKVIDEAIERERTMISDLYNQLNHNQEQSALEKEKIQHIQIVKED